MSDIDFEDIFEDKGWESLPSFPDLKGKTVFITGGGSGIGAYFTASFAMAGAKVGFVSLNKAPAERLCDRIEAKTNNRPLALQADIKNIDSLKHVIDSVREKFGAIEILINNAARDTRHTLKNLSVEDWNSSIETNLRPQFFSAQHVVHDMETLGGGTIINLGSVSANLGLAGYPAYVAAKAGIIGLTKALARELGPNNIRVNCITPGWVITARQKRLWANDEDLKKYLTTQSIKRPLNGWDIAGPALFLASKASAMISGQEIIVDGGKV
jgi:NAD(P)-dependent dehydrogenase (short-subunit alcohol dehydrogenase family)